MGKRDGLSAHEFIEDLSRRTVGRFQLTTDGLEDYIPAVEEHYSMDIHFAQLIKNYVAPRTDGPD